MLRRALGMKSRIIDSADFVLLSPSDVGLNSK